MKSTSREVGWRAALARGFRAATRDAARCVDAAENVSSLLAADYHGDESKSAVKFLYKKKVFLKCAQVDATTSTAVRCA